MKKRILYNILNEWRDEDMDDSPIDIDDDMEFEPTSSDMDLEPNLDDDDFVLSTNNQNIHKPNIKILNGYYYNPYYIKSPIFSAKDMGDAEKKVKKYLTNIYELTKNNQSILNFFEYSVNRGKRAVDLQKIQDLIRNTILSAFDIPEKYVTNFQNKDNLLPVCDTIRIIVDVAGLSYDNNQGLPHTNIKNFTNWMLERHNTYNEFPMSDLLFCTMNDNGYNYDTDFNIIKSNIDECDYITNVFLIGYDEDEEINENAFIKLFNIGLSNIHNKGNKNNPKYAIPMFYTKRDGTSFEGSSKKCLFPDTVSMIFLNYDCLSHKYYMNIALMTQPVFDVFLDIEGIKKLNKRFNKNINGSVSTWLTPSPFINSQNEFMKKYIPDYTKLTMPYFVYKK